MHDYDMLLSNSKKYLFSYSLSGTSFKKVDLKKPPYLRISRNCTNSLANNALPLPYNYTPEKFIN